MAYSSTPKYPVNFSYDRSTSNVVSPYITLSILVAGVVGGLVIVIAFILFCKYCVKKKSTLRRDQGTDCERSSDRRFKAFQRYETINSDVFSEPSTGSMDGIPISPRRLYEAKSHEKIAGTEEANETTKLKSDFDKASYHETDLVLEPLTAEGDQTDSQKDKGAKGTEKAERTEDESAGRRVSFQLEDLPRNGYLQKGRRYTDGDFHYLKNIRINNNNHNHATRKNVPRQYSLGANVRYDNQERHPETIELSHFHVIDEAPVASCSQEPQSYTPTRCFDSPSPPDDVIGPQVVDVEVHHRGTRGNRELNNRDQPDSASGVSRFERPGRIGPSKRGPDSAGSLKPYSHSMDVVSPTRRAERTNRRVKSYDDVLECDYDVLKITEFSRGPFNNHDFDPISEMQALGTSKVSYNDMGSLEVLNEENLYLYDNFDFENIIPDESDADTETTINGYQKYREIWNLRTTLEEEEECSDTIRMEDSASLEDHSPDRDRGGASYSPTYHPAVTTESSSTFKPTNGCRSCNKHEEPNRGILFGDGEHCERENSNLLHPNYENRSDGFPKIANKRRDLNSAENSFDSVETGDTDGDMTDTSRQGITTSFESTTDNTDSTNESQTNRLRQMKADSGYKSLEIQQPPVVNGTRKSQTMDDDIIVLESSSSHAEGTKKDEVLEGVGTSETIPRRSSIFEKRKGRTASKRRREYSRERQVVRLYESVHEPETDSMRSDQPSGDSFDEPSQSGTSKFSVFSRFFKSQRSRDKGLCRDFSIDERSNEMFQEFLRYDPKFDNKHRGSSAGIVSVAVGVGGGRRRMSAAEGNRRERLQRKFTDPGPGVFESGPRHWLSPEMRSTSLGSDSSASSTRKRSPQDSIEEEELEDDIDAAVMDHKNRIQEQGTAGPGSNPAEATTPTISVHEIPIIKLDLPEGEVVDV